jgi:hypothetical protein
MPRLIVHGFTIPPASGWLAHGYGTNVYHALTRNAQRMLVIVLLSLSLVHAVAQEDRRSLPTRYTVTLLNGNRMGSRKFTPQMREAIGYTGLKTAQIRFKTGEVVDLDYDSFRQVVMAMSIQLGERRCPVPDSLRADISPHLIGTLELSWDGASKRASGASYFALHFMRTNERRMPADPLIFLRDCSRIGGVELIEELKGFR